MIASLFYIYQNVSFAGKTKILTPQLLQRKYNCTKNLEI